MRLAEAVARDMAGRARALLGAAPLLGMPFEAFAAEVERPCAALLEAWRSEYDSFCEGLRKLRELRELRERGERSVPIGLEPPPELWDRVAALAAFRRQHEELLRVAREGLGPAVLEEVQVRAAVPRVFSVPSERRGRRPTQRRGCGRRQSCCRQRASGRWRRRTGRGWTAWSSAWLPRCAPPSRPRARPRTCSPSLASTRPSLCAPASATPSPSIRTCCSDRSGRFLLFSLPLFHALQVRADIEELAGRLRAGYAASAEARVDALHDTPPVAGAVVWGRQLQRRLEELLRRLEDVLGPGWSANVDGMRLKQEGEALRDGLNPEPLFREWVEQTRQVLEACSADSDHRVAGPVLAVARRGREHALGVAFDERLGVLLRETRALLGLGFRVPIPFTMLATSVRQVYPHAVALRHHVRVYNTCAARAEASPALRLLTAAAHRACQTVLAGAMRLTWTSLKLSAFPPALAAAVAAFSAALQAAGEAAGAADEALAGLAECPFTGEALARQLEAVQRQCDALELAGLANLAAWTRQLQVRAEQLLTARLEQALAAFADALETATDVPGFAPIEGLQCGFSFLSLVSFLLGQECRFAIVLRGGSMVLEPPLAEARTRLLQQLSGRMQTVVALAPLRAGRHQLDTAAPTAAGLGHLLARVPAALLCRCYRLVEEKMRLAGEHVRQWLRYQGLWDMDHQAVYARVGEDQTQWQLLLQQVKVRREG